MKGLVKIHFYTPPLRLSFVVQGEFQSLGQNDTIPVRLSPNRLRDIRYKKIRFIQRKSILGFLEHLSDRRTNGDACTKHHWAKVGS